MENDPQTKLTNSFPKYDSTKTVKMKRNNEKKIS